MSRFLTRRPPLIDESKQPKLVDTRDAQPLDMSAVLPPRFPTLTIVAIAAGLVAYAVVVDMLSSWCVQP